MAGRIPFRLSRSAAGGLLALWVVLGTPGAAADEPYVVGVEDNRYLPHYSYEQGVYLGFGREVLDAFFTAKGHAFEYRALPVARLFRSFVDREVDFKYPDSALWSADLKEGKGIVYSDPVVSTTDGVSVPPDKLGRPVGEIKLLGTVRGFTAWSWIDRIESKQVILSENDSTARLVRQAIMGRVDGAFANVDVIQHLLSNVLRLPEALVFDTSLPHTKNHYHLSTIEHPEVIAEFNGWLKSEAGFVTRLREKYSVGLRED